MGHQNPEAALIHLVLHIEQIPVPEPQKLYIIVYNGCLLFNGYHLVPLAQALPVKAPQCLYGLIGLGRLLRQGHIADSIQGVVEKMRLYLLKQRVQLRLFLDFLLLHQPGQQG